MHVERLCLSWFFLNCYALFKSRGFSLALVAHVSLWHSSRTCVISRGKVSLLDRCQTQIFLAVTGLWDSGKVSLLVSKNFFSNLVATSHSSCVFLYLFSSANISLVRFVLHLQDWRCVGKRETSFPVNKLWLSYLPPSLWPLTMQNRYACKL